ncbi:hypothetical protein RRG08_012968 [Elysia crispata]|uniref:Uncharacterized protein n=1 Tax=Elysia crispata TaxID=231223 RepID=A0AAE1DQM7_9GAST|nr:hypothetical protein RRG08_012968 [Elysia crispata]
MPGDKRQCHNEEPKLTDLPRSSAKWHLNHAIRRPETIAPRYGSSHNGLVSPEQKRKVNKDRKHDLNCVGGSNNRQLNKCEQHLTLDLALFISSVYSPYSPLFDRCLQRACNTTRPKGVDACALLTCASNYAEGHDPCDLCDARVRDCVSGMMSCPKHS